MTAQITSSFGRIKSDIMIEIGNIIKNLSPTEAVVIDKIRRLGSKYSLSYTGVNSNLRASKILDEQQLNELEVLTSEGEFNFKGDPEKFVLFAEAERINSAYQFDPLFAINCSVVDPLPHQVEAVYKYLLPQPKIRFLLADDTGAGKTIMTGLLLKELLMRKIVERVLIVTPGGLTKQWQEDEMGVKFNIPFKLVNRDVFSSEPTVFQTSDRIVTSIDFVSREDIMQVVSKTTWDLVIFDEAHKLSAYEYGEKIYKSKRYEAAHILSQQCEHLLLLTATPHRGRKDTFKRLLQLLDKDIFATADLATERVRELSMNGANKFFIRRLKEDMKDWDGNALYKNRHTKTTSYNLTSDEKRLYDAVTTYLTKRKKEANETKNIHVSLALQVMQRRLVSSIYAIRNTLQKRWLALQGLADELDKNPSLWKQRIKFEELEVANIDDLDELDDEERDVLDNIMADPKKLKLFTTAKSLSEIKAEAGEVKSLYEMANTLYNQQQEEQKYIELKKLLTSQGVIDGEKLVIFTEHKDTLLYLQERLTNNGYNVATIHGGMSVDERRESQCRFMTPDVQVLICTDAAGEGINLQFCRLLINWDIPWNPNRLEQRMGRIHRYGQKSDVLVFNMVASNTREGQVLKKLLTKLDIIREQLGDDRVYDVIQDVLKGVSLDSIISSVLNGQESDLDLFIDKDAKDLGDLFSQSIRNQDKSIAHSSVDYKDARRLKEDSDEKRLQPIYIRLFFERAFKYLGGKYDEIADGIFQITYIPDIIVSRLKEQYRIYAENLTSLYFFFDKAKFLEYQNSTAQYGKAHYINPGNALFDCLIDTVRDSFRDEMLKGTVLVSPEDKHPYFAFFVKNQIQDNRPTQSGEPNISNELLTLICQNEDGVFQQTSPAKLLDLCPPVEFAKEIVPPEPANENEVVEWAYSNQTEPLLEATEKMVKEDTESRREYLQTAFQQIILDIQGEINELQNKILFSDDEKVQQKLMMKEARYNALKVRKKERLAQLDNMIELFPVEPEVLGCAYVLPLNQVEYRNTFGMSRDDEVEAIAMKVAIDYETEHGRKTSDVSKDNVGYDVKSIDVQGNKRYIEVKGRAGTDGVMLSENEMNRLAQLGTKAWLYIVTECRSESPILNIINDPARKLVFEQKTKGVQFYLPLNEWQSKKE
jgi:SNF2 family DNA or RNA helicase